MGFLDDLKNTFKMKLKVGIMIIIAGIIIGILIGYLRGGKKIWTPPRNVNREYRGEIIQKLRQGKTAPVIKQKREDIKPEKKEQKTREITPPPASKKEFEPSAGDSYSDF